MYRLISSILFCLIWFGSASSQEQGERVLRIRQFGGLNTIAGDFAMKPSDARIAHNIDFGRNVGSISKRYGYDSISVVAGQDSAIGLYGAYYSDGTQQLIFVTDSSDVGYGNIYASPKGKAHFTGLNKLVIGFNTHDNYTYVDSFMFDTGSAYDTVVISYTSDGSATNAEIVDSLVDSVNASADLSGYFTAAKKPTGYRPIGGNYWYEVTAAKEFIDASAIVDSASALTTKQLTTARIWTHWGIQSKPSFAMYGDNVYIVNGVQKGVAYNGSVARSFPLNAPGEPTIVPLNTSGPLDGEYRYVFRFARTKDTDSLQSIGVVSSPVRVSSGQALLKDFIWVGSDSIYQNPAKIFIYGYRTRTNPGPLDPHDTAYAMGWIVDSSISATALASVTFIDSIADEQLDSSISVVMIDKNWVGRDSTGSLDTRYGAPTFLSTPTTLSYTPTTDTTVAGGVYHGIPGQVDTMGVMYRVSFIDTVFAIESDLGPPLTVWVNTAAWNQAAKPKSYEIGLPTAPAGDSGIVRNLYRAHILQVTHDSVFNFFDSLVQLRGNDAGLWDGLLDEMRPSGWVSRLIADTVIVSEYRLVAQVSASDTAYIDSIRWDSLQNKRMFTRASPPLLDQIFAYDGRMFGTQRSRLYWSRLDSVSAWGAFNSVSLGQNDGSKIQAAYPSRGGVTVLKDKTRYTVWQDNNTNWNRRHINGFIGCIASKSLAAGPLGVYYLSADGVRRTADGMTLDRTYTDELISAPLKNFNELSTVTKSEAVGFYFDQKYMLCIGDTTYVYDERSKTWATWGFRFADATLYGVESQVNFIPGDSMYFIRPGDSNLYRYGSSEQDNGNSFTIDWRSGPLLLEPMGWKQINSIALMGNSDAADNQVALILYDQTNTLIQNITDGADQHFLRYTNLQNQPYVRSVAPKQAFSYRIHLGTASDVSDDNLVINGLDIMWRWLGYPIAE